MSEIQPTKYLQLQSLRNFMSALGYEFSEFGCYFWSEQPENKHRSVVSFFNAVRWHNNSFIEWHGKYYNAPWGVDAYTFTKAQAAKIVYCAKLQYNKKEKKIVCQSHKVSFVKEAYVDMFLENNDE